jgi:hypothetical protein
MHNYATRLFVTLKRSDLKALITSVTKICHCNYTIILYLLLYLHLLQTDEETNIYLQLHSLLNPYTSIFARNRESSVHRQDSAPSLTWILILPIMWCYCVVLVNLVTARVLTNPCHLTKLTVVSREILDVVILYLRSSCTSDSPVRCIETSHNPSSP